MQLAHATRLGPYEILSPLGTGAMGEVYRARDSRLNRDVALKIIAAEYMGDARRRRRFEQEARSASALNHPNIVTIYDLGLESGSSYMVSELVDGESLREVIRRGPLSMHQLLSIAVQMADGLAAAHGAGIIHRDFKPENIMISREGRVKILDFGLAKPLPSILSATNDTAASDEHAAATEPGVILGTVGYMSPEQASGQDVGIQADQFSIGVILHELATGQAAFKRQTPLETLLAIARVDQKPFTPGPSAFRLLVDRLLSKEPSHRFVSTDEITTRLRKIQLELPHVTEPAPDVAQRVRIWERLRPRLQAPRFLWPALLCALVTGLWFLQVPPSVQSAPSLAFQKFADERPLQAWPAWSPDGRTLAYAGDVDGHLQIFTQRAAGGAPSQITQGAQDCFYPLWSNSGNLVYYVQPTGATRDLWRAGTWDGHAERVLQNVYQADLAVDGQLTAMLRSETDEPTRLSLWTANSPQSPPARLQTSGWGNGSILAPSFVRISPDRRHLALWATTLSGATELWLIPTGGQPARRLSSPTGQPRWFAWEDPETLLIPSDTQLSRWSLSGKSSPVLASGPGRMDAPAFFTTSPALALTTGDASYRLETAKLAPNTPGTGPVHQAGHSPAWSPARAEYAYAAERHGRPGLWLHDSDGDERLVVEPAQFADGSTTWLGDPSFSPHGFRLLFRRISSAGSSLWITPVHGQTADPMPVAQHESAPEPGDWSPDGHSIVYSALRQGKRTVLTQRVDSEGNADVLQLGSDPRWSPTGNEIAFRAPDGRAMLMNTDGSGSRAITTSPVLALAWEHSHSRLWFLHERDGHLQLSNQETAESVDLGPRAASLAYAQATAGRPIDGLSFSPDGRSVTYSALENRAGIWLVSGWR